MKKLFYSIAAIAAVAFANVNAFEQRGIHELAQAHTAPTHITLSNVDEHSNSEAVGEAVKNKLNFNSNVEHTGETPVEVRTI